jgi:branched-chain amino acid aminotransferase
MEIAEDMGYDVIERDISRVELYTADEVFMTGTAAEMTAVAKIDNRIIGDGRPGPITVKLRTAFKDATVGKSQKYAEWLDIVI